MVHVDSRASVSAGESHNHQKPIGQMHDGKAYCGQDGDGVDVMRQEIGKAIHKVAVEYVLLDETPGAIEQQTQARALPGNLANGVEDQADREDDGGDEAQDHPELGRTARHLPFETKLSKAFTFT